jgi:thymidylate synthase (FAD)
MQNSDVQLVWTTPCGQDLISEMARVSNPSNAKNTETAPKLIRYLITNAHWSPFELANMCISIKTSRAISRQILRHRTMTANEFSQRYADPVELSSFDLGLTEARLQDTKNRQNSLDVDDSDLQNNWAASQNKVLSVALEEYNSAINRGIAKEVARAVLPEGLTPTHLYINGSLRSWIHFCQLRCGNGTQKEATDIANKVRDLIKEHYPDVYEAAFLIK